MGLISWVVIGAVVGLVGYAVSGRRKDKRPIVAALVGGVVGGTIAAVFGAGVISFSLLGAALALVFAIAALVLLRRVTR